MYTYSSEAGVPVDDKTMTKRKIIVYFNERPGFRIKDSAGIFPFLIIEKGSLELLFLDTANSLTGLKKFGAGF